MQFFQGKYDARQGRIEGSGQARAGTSCNQVPFLHAGPAQRTAQPLCRYSTDLDRRTFPSQGKAQADT